MENTQTKRITEELKTRLMNGENIIIKTPMRIENTNGYLTEPTNYLTGKQYTGVNRALLPVGFYLTWAQAKQLGGKVNKGAKARLITICRPCDYVEYTTPDGEKKTIRKDKFEEEKPPVKEGTTPEDRTLFFTNIKYVFNITDITGLPYIDHTDLVKQVPEVKVPDQELSRLGEAVKNLYVKKTGVRIKPDCDIPSSAYSEPDDTIFMKNFFEYQDSSRYYHELFHEMSHSTGHHDRLKRKLGNKFGSDPYSQEEMIAETSAILVLYKLGLLTNELYQEATDYVKSWYDHIKDKDDSFLLNVLSRADKAQNYILSE